MLWEGKQLRDLRDGDLRAIIESGLEEHLQLEYKAALYEDNDRGRRELLLDVSMFANAAGGIILIGVPERRDEQGQPTGEPDPTGVLGLDLPNPGAVLAAYDARVMEAIEERLPLESASIDVENGRRVLAIRVPNSTRKPHSVRHQGHIYFPSRRERQRYHLSVREIKELVMRTASRLQQAESVLDNAFDGVPRAVEVQHDFIIGMIPVFFEDFSVDVRADNIRQAVGNFNRAERAVYREPIYTFEGLERHEDQYHYTVQFRRNGLLRASLQLPLKPQAAGAENQHVVVITSFDVLLRRFVQRASAVYEAAGISGPFVLGMRQRNVWPLVGAYAGVDGLEYNTDPIRPLDYHFPYMQVDNLADIDGVIRPLCDQAHQTFGREGSPSFNGEGVWVARYP